MNTFSIPTIDEIKDAISETLLKHIEDPEGRITLYNKKKTAELLGVCQSTVDNLRLRGVLVATYIGSKPMFRYEDILNFINKNHKSK